MGQARGPGVEPRSKRNRAHEQGDQIEGLGIKPDVELPITAEVAGGGGTTVFDEFGSTVARQTIRPSRKASATGRFENVGPTSAA